MEKPKDDFKYLVRISNTDLDGNKKIVDSIRKIRGIGFTFANAVCQSAGVKTIKKTGYLSDDEVKKLEETIKTAHSKFPAWLLNRRRNAEDGSSLHMVTVDLKFAQENDIRQMQRIRTYRGVRHMAGAPVRGQRTRSNFRRNKGKVLGVVKSKAIQQATAGKEKEDKK